MLGVLLYVHVCSQITLCVCVYEGTVVANAAAVYRRGSLEGKRMGGEWLYVKSDEYVWREVARSGVSEDVWQWRKCLEERKLCGSEWDIGTVNVS